VDLGLRHPELLAAELRLPELRLPELRLPELRLPELRLTELRLTELRLTELRLDLLERNRSRPDVEREDRLRRGVPPESLCHNPCQPARLSTEWRLSKLTGETTVGS